MSITKPGRPSRPLSPGANVVQTDDYDKQSQKLSLDSRSSNSTTGRGDAIEAEFITPLDPVIVTADYNRLPAVPVQEAYKLNALKDEMEGWKTSRRWHVLPRGLNRFDRMNGKTGRIKQGQDKPGLSEEGEKLGAAIPPSKTHPLFPPLPLYGPASPLRNLQCLAFRVTSAFLSTAFLLVIVLGAIYTSIPKLFSLVWYKATFGNPDKRRPFFEEERRRAKVRREDERRWVKEQKAKKGWWKTKQVKTSQVQHTPFEGGPDALICDVRYYARRVGLDIEEFKVQTEDGFIITLWHVYDPTEYSAVPRPQRSASSPNVFRNTPALDGGDADKHNTSTAQFPNGRRRYPVLLMHGLLQSAGAYCVNDDDSLAFFLHKSGYDVWLGNNRCGFHPQHSLLKYSDPRMWAWNIRQMGVMDLPALISRVLDETGFPRVGLVCHSQGTTETFVALAKEQRPELGDKISVFCALAPAVYAGPLIGKMYFKFMRVISPAMFRIFFGIHSFIPIMMTMHSTLPGKWYGAMGYQVFSFLFDWTDTRWDRGLRDRFFLFSPVYVSSESMRWWLGRECFAKHKCVLSTKEEGQLEDDEDENGDGDIDGVGVDGKKLEEEERKGAHQKREDRDKSAWYDNRVPPMALWIAGSDDLVDGRRLLRRFERGREPNVNLVHAKIIPEYEHLDVLWAMDAVEKVGVEVKEVIWRCMNDKERELCRRIEGVCDDEDEDVGRMSRKEESA